jgi:hypothetical protein
MSEVYMYQIQTGTSARLQYDAERYLRDLQDLNSPTSFADSGVKISMQALASIGAGRGPLSKTFSSLAAKSSVVNEFPNIEVVLYEGWRRLKDADEWWIKYSTMAKMEKEVRRFLDMSRECEAENVEEIMYFALKSARVFSL